MDTVTYPEKNVLEASKSFVCIRLDFDKAPELVKKHGVGALTDLRLLDASGKEAAKLVGFTSAQKLLSRMKAVLEGKPADDGKAAARAAVPVTDANLERAVKKGLDFLRGAKDPAEGSFSSDELVLFARSVCGEAKADDAVEIAKRPLAGTYQASLRALALSRIDAKRFGKEIGECSAWLCKAQLENGQWTYGPPKDGEDAAHSGNENKERLKPGDNSNTAYALLGLAACKRAGVDVPKGAIEKADAWWRKSQNRDGGWGYRPDREIASYASMTESGVSSLLLTRSLLGTQGEDKEVEKGKAWLAASFSVSENAKSAYQQGRLLYHLFALERTGSLSGAAKLGEHDWFQEGAGFLLSTQRDDGSWDDGADTPIPNTCFALVFLGRGSAFLK